jgi:hypothetical protein
MCACTSASSERSHLRTLADDVDAIGFADHARAQCARVEVAGDVIYLDRVRARVEVELAAVAHDRVAAGSARLRFGRRKQAVAVIRRGAVDGQGVARSRLIGGEHAPGAGDSEECRMNDLAHGPRCVPCR